MLEVENEATVAAPLAAAWAAITKFENYPRWHPFVVIDGVAQPGAVIGYAFKSRAPKARRWAVEARVIEYEPEQRLTINIGFGFFGVEETYSISPLPNGVSIVHGFRFSGVFSPLGLIPAVKRNLARLLTVEDAYLAQHIAGRARGKPSKRR